MSVPASDFAWTDGDLTDDWAEAPDGVTAYVERLQRALTTNGLWYRPGWGRDVRAYLLDTATDAQIAIEVQQVIESDPETARADVRVTRTGTSVEIETIPNTGTREFFCPSEGFGSDWVLVLDDASKNFGPPGREAR